MNIMLYCVILPFTLSQGLLNWIDITWQPLFILMEITIQFLILATVLLVFDLLLKIRHNQETKKWRTLLNPQYTEKN